MADTPETNLIKKEADAPAPDPITYRSTSSILLVCALLLTGVLAWALYDEVYGQRPWKSMQQSFVKRYTRHLKRLKRRGNPTEQEIKESAEYQELDAAAKAAAAAVEPRKVEIDRQIAFIEDQLAVITDPYQDKRGKITVINYQIETSDESNKKDLQKEVEEEKNDVVEVRMPAAGEPGRIEEQKLNYNQLEERFYRLKDEKATLLAARTELLKESSELQKKREDYLKENMIGLSADQVNALLKKNETFDYQIRQINVASADIVDRCETCHLGVREPLELTPAAFMRSSRSKPDSRARAFVSHPNRELLRIHDPERFGCSSCHGGNGRATTTVAKAHGENKHWLFPLHRKENLEAGCQQCHMQDRVLEGAPTLTLGKDLFQERGCVGCHRYEGFDRETDGLTNTRQMIKQLEDERAANEREARQAALEVATAPDDAAAQKLLARAEALRVTNSQLEARMEQLSTQSRYLLQDQKKVGPNLKDVRLKLRKEWIPVWLQDPQKFRPGTKMPTYWRLDGEGMSSAESERETAERKAIAAYLWQESFEGQVPEQPRGNASNGKALFESRGCLGCHSVGSPGNEVGGNFAANLQRVGEKASYNYIVRWIHNPRDRWAPYCPKEKRDLTRADYEQKNLPFVFDVNHSRCPNDGTELQVQNMTVMPNFRLSEEDTRDIATYLFSLSGESRYPDASYMDDVRLKAQGHTLIKQYGCAGCHEIKGFEDEQRIGKELTTEGATPIERLDFALLTHDAEMGKHPFKPNEKVEPWYNRRGFFINKLETPWIYDLGKEKEPKDMLRMPEPYLGEDERGRNALVTFLLGSVGTEGANVPRSLFYNPTDQQKDIQEGWWVIKKYNCMGCHTVQVGQSSDLAGLPFYQTPEGKVELPPGLTTEGARVDPNWLLRFLRDPSLSERGENGQTVAAHAGAAQTNDARQTAPSSGGVDRSAATVSPNAAGAATGRLGPQPGENRNGVRTYLKARMPTFNFSPNELRTLVRFFLAVSAQQEPYIREQMDPLSDQERQLARALFTSQAAPCLKCHLTGDPSHDQSASAPNFLQAGDRLKPGWTFRWLLDPQRIMPGTAMPSELFEKVGDRWVLRGMTPEIYDSYNGDHAQLLVRYMLQLTPDEQRRIAAGSPSAAPAAAPAAAGQTAAAHRGLRTPAAAEVGGAESARRGGDRHRRRPAETSGSMNNSRSSSAGSASRRRAPPRTARQFHPAKRGRQQISAARGAPGPRAL